MKNWLASIAVLSFVFAAGCHSEPDAEQFDVTLWKDGVVYHAFVEFPFDGSSGTGSMCDPDGCEDTLDGDIVGPRPADTVLAFPVRHTSPRDGTWYSIGVRQPTDGEFPSADCEVTPGVPSVAACTDGSSLSFVPR